VQSADQAPVPQEQWWWSMAMVVALGLLVVVGIAVAAMVLDTKDAGTVAGAAFTAVGTLVTAFIGLKTTQNQANSAAVFAAHVPDSQADHAVEQAQIRRQSG
jgi:protein-S-isoprenylcysteine O-methyltransferase Ste14